MKKIILIICSAVVIALLMPRSGMADFSVIKGSIWQDEPIKAPFDIPIYKSTSGMAAEREEVNSKFKPVFRSDTAIVTRQLSHAAHMLPNLNRLSGAHDDQLLTILQYIYAKGIVTEAEYNAYVGRVVLVSKNNMLENVPVAELFTPEIAAKYIASKKIDPTPILPYITPNLTYDENLNKEIRGKELASLSRTKGMIRSGDMVVAKGQLIDNDAMQVLDSFKHEYESRMGGGSSFWYVLGGRFMLVFLLLMVNYLFFEKFQSLYFGRGLKEMLFIMMMYTLLSAGVGLAVRGSITNPFMIPVPIIAIYMLTFFNMRVAIMGNLTMSILGAMFVRMPFEFFTISVIGGLVAIFMMRNYYRRGNLFRAVGVILLTQSFVYICLSLMRQGDFQSINYGVLVWLVISSFLILGLCQLVYLIERAFGFVSDITLLELCDTNQPLLLELAEKAPGTFQHSVQVANLAESAALEIRANALLTRTGALYHDIGKINNPFYFVENLSGEFNPHNDIEPTKSAEILRQHVVEGAAIARKANLPSKVIDFIVSHHGTSRMFFFWNAQQEKYGTIENEALFTYPGPKPVSKEVSICMMADAVEAASRSLKSYDAGKIEELVDKIVAIQMSEGQLDDSMLSLKEIANIKQVFSGKLNNIYHARIAYPERKS